MKLHRVHEHNFPFRRNLSFFLPLSLSSSISRCRVFTTVGDVRASRLHNADPLQPKTESSSRESVELSAAFFFYFEFLFFSHFISSRRRCGSAEYRFSLSLHSLNNLLSSFSTTSRKVRLSSRRRGETTTTTMEEKREKK